MSRKWVKVNIDGKIAYVDKKTKIVQSTLPPDGIFADATEPNSLCNWVEREKKKESKNEDGEDVPEMIVENVVTGVETDRKPNFYKHGKALSYSDRSCFLWDSTSTFRNAIVSLISHDMFDNFILLVIILNSISLAIPQKEVAFGVDLEYDLAFKGESERASWWESSYKIYVGGDEKYEGDPDKSDWTLLADSVDIVFTIIFTIEAVLKIIGMGFFLGKGSYLRDGWNVIDFTVVVAGLLAFLPGFPRISALRTIRVMRPLRSLSVMPSMRNLINTLIGSIPALANVLMLLGFVFLIFGILAIQLWAGIQTNRCRITSKPLAAPASPLVYTCSSSGAVIETLFCEVPGNGDVPTFECNSISDCVVKEHLTLMGEVFGADDQVSAPELAKKYVAAMVTRVFIKDDGTVVPLHYCGYDDQADTNDHVFPSFYEGFFPEHERLRDNSIEHTKKLVDLTPDDGPWSERRRDCFWPIYEDGRVCSKEDVGLAEGLNTCGRMSLAFPSDADEWLLGTSVLAPSANDTGCPSIMSSYFSAVTENSAGDPRTPQCYDIESRYASRRDESVMFVHTTCGTDADINGNRRFVSDAIDESGVYVEDLAFGYTQFNDIIHACQTIFQSITEEGWTDIMYQIQDADSPFFAALYFCSLIVFGSFVCMNLTLAVMWEEFSKAQNALEDKERREVATRMRYGNVQNLAREAKSAEEIDDAPATKESKSSDPESGTETTNAGDEGLSFFYFGIRGSHENSTSTLVRTLNRVSKSKYLEGFIIFCILLNTVTLSMDRYDQPHAESDALEIVNFVLTIVFAVEMALKISGLGLREYVKDRFNQFDAVIVIASLIEMAILPPTFMSDPEPGEKTGGALSVMRAFRLFRLFKLARSWTSLQKLLRTMAKTLSDISSFALLLLLFIYIFALCGMQFFANKFRFDDDGRGLDITTSVLDNAADAAWNQSVAVFGMPTAMWRDPDSGDFINPEFVAAEPPYAHFDDFPWSCTTVFQVLSGENWNTVMYDGWRSTSWLAALFFACMVVLGIMIVLELFVAVLLANFEGNDEEDDASEKKETDEEDAEKKRKEASGSSMFERAANFLEFDKSLVKNAPGAKVAPASSGEVDGSIGAKDASESTDAKSERVLRGTSLWLLGPKNPIRVAISKIVFHPWFDRCILVLIILSSLMLAIETPLDDPDSTKADVMKTLDLFFTIAFIVEMVLKHVTLGVMYYWADGWNVLDGAIVIVSIVVKASEGNSSLSALRALRTLRVLRPLRMINRAPGLKRVVKALLYSFPKILDVFIVCTLFFLIFAIVGINFLKGKLNMCDGDMTPAELHFMLDAKWSALDGAETDVTWTWSERLIDDGSPFASCTISDPPPDTSTNAPLYYFDANGDFQHNFVPSNPFYQEWDSDEGVYVPYDSLEDWADAELPYNFNTDEHDISCRCESGRWECATSKDACLGLKATERDVDWVRVTYQHFDDIFSAMSCLFELSTTEGWVDVMYAAVDARGIDMQPSRETNAFEWVIFFVAFIIWGSFFVLNLFVGVVCDTFNEMSDKFGSDFLLTETQKKWVESQKRINRLGPFLRRRMMEKAPNSEIQRRMLDIVRRPSFDNFIMGCIIVNSFLLMLRWHGQSYELATALMWINFAFAIIFTVEAVMKLIALRFRYFDDGWNVFDFVIVVATDIFIILKYTTDMNLVSLATVMRTFRVLRIFRLIRAAKELRKLINTVVVSLPQLANVAMLLVLFLFIFAVMGVQMFAKIAFEDAYNEHANFQSFGTAVLTLMRATTGENWNGMMYSMSELTDECLDDPEYTRLRCGFEDALDECLDLNGCGKPEFATFFWIAFSILVSFMVLNMFVALILDAFDDVSNEEDAALNEEQWETFCNAWITFLDDDETVEAAFRIQLDKLKPLMQKLPYPMGFLRTKTNTVLETDKQVENEVQRMNIPFVTLDEPGKSGLFVEFFDVASAVAKRSIVIEHNDADSERGYKDLHDAESHLIKTGKVRRKTIKSTMKLGSQHYYAAARIASAYRTIKFRQHIKLLSSKK